MTIIMTIIRPPELPDFRKFGNFQALELPKRKKNDAFEDISTHLTVAPAGRKKCRR